MGLVFMALYAVVGMILFGLKAAVAGFGLTMGVHFALKLAKR